MIISGNKVSLITDAGTPCISDPGFLLIREAIKNKILITCLPGPTAFIPALVMSGLPCDSFVFEGFLPRKKGRKSKLFEISQNTKTTILYESPHRLKKLLRELFDFCGGDREIIVARELTKKFEEHVGNDINSAINFFKDKEVVGEITLVLKGSKHEENKQIKNYDIKKELHELINAGLSVSSASKYLAKKYGIKKSIIYSLK